MPIQLRMRMSDHENELLTFELISRALTPYLKKPLGDPQLLGIAKYIGLLRKWNETVSLTSIEGDTEIVAWHFGESIFAGSVLPIESGRLADVGSGAGFPGLALKIAFSDLEVSLIEPNAKKCAFLREVQSILGLNGVEVVRNRYEDFRPRPGSFDFISSRALGGYKRLLRWSKAVLQPQGSAILWLGLEDSNLITRAKGWQWQLPVSIPESRRRVVLAGKPAF